jgi:anti-anti-sigma factor
MLTPLDHLAHHLAGRDAAILVVTLPPDLNHESAEPVRDLVHRHLPNREGAAVVIDFAAVEMVSSIGVAALLQIQEFCRDHDARLVLAALSRRQLDFFRMLTLDRKFALARSLGDAVAELDR